MEKELKFKYLNTCMQDEEYLGNVKTTLFKAICEEYFDTQYMQEKDEVNFLRNI
jgi:hypothetical protein